MKAETTAKWKRHAAKYGWSYACLSGIWLLTANLLAAAFYSERGLTLGILFACAGTGAMVVRKRSAVWLLLAGALLLYASAFLSLPLTLALSLLFHTGLCMFFVYRVHRLLLARNKYKAVSEEMEYMAYHDALTGLPNRRLFDDRLKQALLHAKRNGHLVSVLFLDLDRFKQVNDSLGHKSGDDLIRQAGERLLGCVRVGDTVYRQGGDEFTILLEFILKPEDVSQIASRIQNALERPFVLEGQSISVTASMGIALYPIDGETPDQLMAHADEAMYRAKERGSNYYQFYAPEINAMVAGKVQLENALRHAVEHGELELHYQPQYELAGNKLIGMEAVLRWTRPGVGMVPNQEWMRTAEESGLIIPIGMWALLTACRQTKAWQDEGYPDLKLSVGVSAVQFRQSNFLDLIEEVLKETGLQPEHLELDLAEGISSYSIQEVSEKLRILKAFGVRIAMDDLCAGLFTRSDSDQMPVDTLKLDSTLIRDLPEDSENQALAAAITKMAQRLQLNLVAKGVETKEQLEHLQFLDCKEVQGQLFSNPLHPTEFFKLLKDKIS